MNRNLKIALAFVALAGMAGTASAIERHGRDGGMRGFVNQFEDADADSSGGVTLEEFTAAVGDRFIDADANDDGSMTVEEIADALERMRNLRRAERIVNRLDIDNDGAVSDEEVEAAHQRRFARLDRDNNGTIEENELQRMDRRGERRMERRERRMERRMERHDND
jgi:Ca2+-binding EF-hand superfamily protein